MKRVLCSVFSWAVLVGLFSLKAEAAEFNLNTFSTGSAAYRSPPWGTLNHLAFNASNQAFPHLGWVTTTIADVHRGNGNGRGQGKGYGRGQGKGSGRSIQAVPIPGTFLLFGSGFAGFAAWRWRHNRRTKNRMRR